MTSPAGFFEHFPAAPAASAGLDAMLAAPGPAVTILFLWGYQCPNCDTAKRAMLLHQADLVRPELRWLHCNVYEDPDMATRFSLHGVPVFMVFRGTKSAGRITGWPGIDPFVTAIGRQLALVQPG